LCNHAPDIAAIDLFVVPTIGFDLLYAFVIVRLDRRDLVWINVRANPTAEWVARQITEAFPWDEAPHYLIRDRDRISGSVVTRRSRAMGIRDKPTAPCLGSMSSPNGRSGRSAPSAWIISSFSVRRIYVGSCDLTRTIITTSERIGHWTKTRRFLAQFSRPESSVHTPFLVDFTTIMPELKLSVHPGPTRSAASSRLARRPGRPRHLWNLESDLLLKGNSYSHLWGETGTTNPNGLLQKGAPDETCPC
jgi:hypothetical protein